jgi:hypothetical protein
MPLASTTIRRGVDASPSDLSPARAYGRARDVALAVCVVVGTLLRFWALGSQRLNYDEAFTAMTARRSLGSMFSFLRVADSHPPLGYLLHSPFALAGLSAFWIRLPDVVCSITALGLFAWWMRRHGVAGLVATALMAVSAFQIAHGREARMYSVMELVGVASAFVVASWLERPRRWHAPLVGVLVFIGLLTHVSMFLLGAGLLCVPGRRTDREAWRWRIALAGGLLGWMALWGPSFVAQTAGGHSDWIPRTSLSGLVTVLGQLATPVSWWRGAAVALVVIGGVLISLRGQAMTRVWTCCFAVPVALAALAGLVAPVLLDRVLTVVSWGALFAIAITIETLARVAPRAAVVVAVLLIALTVPSAVHAITGRSVPDIVIRHLEAVSGPGDAVAVHPPRRRPEIAWPLAVAVGNRPTTVTVPGLRKSAAIRLTGAPSTGRVWLLEWRRRSRIADGLPRCAPDWQSQNARVICLRLPTTP